MLSLSERSAHEAQLVVVEMQASARAWTGHHPTFALYSQPQQPQPPQPCLLLDALTSTSLAFPSRHSSVTYQPGRLRHLQELLVIPSKTGTVRLQVLRACRPPSADPTPVSVKLEGWSSVRRERLQYDGLNLLSFPQDAVSLAFPLPHQRARGFLSNESTPVLSEAPRLPVLMGYR